MCMHIEPDGGLFSKIRLLWSIFNRLHVVFKPEFVNLGVNSTV